jgi:hypothetical protein
LEEAQSRIKNGEVNLVTVQDEEQVDERSISEVASSSASTVTKVREALEGYPGQFKGLPTDEQIARGMSCFRSPPEATI